MREEDLEKFAELVGQKIETLAKAMGDRQELDAYVKREIDAETTALRAQMKKDFDEGVAAHRNYISELYSKFERMVYIALTMIFGIVAFLGYSEL